MKQATAAAAASAPLFSPATDGAPRPQVKEGIGPQLPRPNRVRVPTRRELASYGIKLPSQRMAEEKPVSPTTKMMPTNCIRMSWRVSLPPSRLNATGMSTNTMFILSRMKMMLPKRN